MREHVSPEQKLLNCLFGKIKNKIKKKNHPLISPSAFSIPRTSPPTGRQTGNEIMGYGKTWRKKKFPVYTSVYWNAIRIIIIFCRIHPGYSYLLLSWLEIARSVLYVSVWRMLSEIMYVFLFYLFILISFGFIYFWRGVCCYFVSFLSEVQKKKKSVPNKFRFFDILMKFSNCHCI